jgi:hypothetical protein
MAYLMTFGFGVFVLERYGLSLSKVFDIDSIRKTLKFSLGNVSNTYSIDPVSAFYKKGCDEEGSAQRTVLFVMNNMG